jgi:RHS repeat-associated protein
LNALAFDIKPDNYYPFGSLMPGRSFNANGYRFGFNGKEKDDEIDNVTGSKLDFGARIYDSRLGRWLSIDPLAAKYPSLSAYNFVANNPIIYIDPDGERIIVSTIEGQKQTLQMLEKAFGDKAKDFSFKDNELVYNGDPTAFASDEAELFDGLFIVMISDDITEIVFKRTLQTDKLGGEFTATYYENPEHGKNTIYIDPIDFFVTNVINTETEYIGKYGGKVTDPEIAKTNPQGSPIVSGVKTTTSYIKDSKSSRFFHSIGHVLYPRNSEQENVIKFENIARKVFKTKNEDGSYTSSPEEYREVDKYHKNKPDSNPTEK